MLDVLALSETDYGRINLVAVTQSLSKSKRTVVNQGGETKVLLR